MPTNLLVHITVFLGKSTNQKVDGLILGCSNILNHILLLITVPSPCEWLSIAIFWGV